jgi:hypothetical protein
MSQLGWINKINEQKSDFWVKSYKPKKSDFCLELSAPPVDVYRELGSQGKPVWP